MKTPLAPFLVTLALALPAALVAAPANLGALRAQAAQLLAYGRPLAPTNAPAADAQPNASIAELVAQHERALQQDSAARRAVIAKASIDALGRPANDADFKADAANAVTYVALMRAHVRALAAAPAEYDRVIRRSYQGALGRAPYDVEVDYWKARPVMPYAILVGCLENWARRNAPGLMATSGAPAISSHCPYLISLGLPPTVADEARLAGGLGAASPLALAAGRHLIAAGADEVIAIGGIHFLAVGAPDLPVAKAN